MKKTTPEEKIIVRAKWYAKNRVKLIKKAKDYSKKTNYVYDKSLGRKKFSKIREDTRNLYKLGKLKKSECQLCKSTNNLEFHHPDYNLPNVVLVLCRVCHRLEHRNKGVIYNNGRITKLVRQGSRNAF